MMGEDILISNTISTGKSTLINLYLKLKISKNNEISIYYLIGKNDIEKI